MRKSILAFLLLPAFALTGCSDFKDNLGLSRPSPDEFRVVSRAPLVLPPDFTLRPPANGAANLGAVTPRTKAESALLGTDPNTKKSDAKLSNGESKLLDLTGGDKSDPSIKATIDRESAQLAEANKTLLDKIRDYEPPATLVDPVKEKERLEKNKAEGKPANEGQIPMIQPKRKGLFNR
ncbi:MAG: DUF3035 domain-containing protein [Alphaproteobacteria bacterium]|nr:MAG: DUF3035 domain-containing protein [Alphaproteobacteria bacterium]